MYLPYHNHICTNSKYVPQMPHIFHMYQLLHVHVRQLCQYIYLIWPQCSQYCHQEHWYTYMSHNDIWPRTNMPATFYMLHCTSTIGNTNPTILHIASKINQMKHLFTILLHNVLATNMPHQMSNMPYVEITWHEFMGEVWQYTCHIWSCSH